MALIHWRDEFTIGVPAIDFEHRELVDLINQSYQQAEDNADVETLLECMGEIYARISSHFALEEKEMQDHSYDQFQIHKADHESLLDELSGLIAACEQGAASPASVIGEKLDNWFSIHFKTHDSRLHKYLNY